jgi:hypothetical protein
MRGLGVVILVAIGIGSFSACGGGDQPLVRGGGGADDPGAEGGRSNSDAGAAGDSKGLAGERPSDDSGAGRSGGDDDDTGACVNGTLGCPCYGNDTCNGLLRCEDGICRDCSDGDEGCSCYGNDTCNGELTCESGICVDETGSAAGGAAPDAGGSSGVEAGGRLPEGTGGSLPEGTGGSLPEGTGGSLPEGTGGSLPEGTGGSLPEGTGGGAAVGCGDPLMIDDFEDGDTDACPRSGWTSDWWAHGDDYGSLSPSPAAIEANKDVLSVPLSPARGTSQRGLHLQGTGFTDWGAEISLVLDNPGEQIPQPVDLSQYEGVGFWARGSGTVRLRVPTPETLQPEAGGTCSGEYPDCWDYFAGTSVSLASDWVQYSVSFGSLQKDWAGTSMQPADQENVVFLLFSSDSGSFDLWLDDVTFY